ncbi:MAG TPA: methyltransferase domain-containing protein, partial [Polyangia bacterium]|nr:methyltransferase domain-containing protein [Polyangia bacterium]
AEESGVSAKTATRLHALARAVAEQVADVAAMVGTALEGPLLPEEGDALPRGAGDYLPLLCRDWAWRHSPSDDQTNGHDDENARSVAAIQDVTSGAPLGRTLVLGAGGCRLAYDLHRQCGAHELAAVDIDPFLLIPAAAIIRGTPFTLTETSVNAPDVEPAGRVWPLAAPTGPIPPEALHFFLADGTAPPFLDETFDTVVTPWFIDQVPTDLTDLLGRIHRLLVPGGRWINHGPLIYRGEALPIARWYTREELFELAQAKGFRPGRWTRASQAHLLSPLTGRGLIENVLTFTMERA